MCTRSTVLVLAAALLGGPARAQGLDLMYGGATGEFCAGAVSNASGYRLAATRFDRTAGRHLAWLCDVNNSGAQIQGSEVALPQRVFLHAIASAPAGGTYLLGSWIINGRDDHDAFLARLGSSNAVLWTATEDLPGDQQLNGMVVLPDGSVIATGVERTTMKHDVLVMRFDVNGGVTWRTTMGTGLDEEGHAVAADANGVIVVGRQMNFGNTSDAYLARLDLDGNVEWESSWGGIRDEGFRAVTSTASGHFVAAGFSDSYGDTTYLGHRYRHAWLMGLQANGDTLWTRAIGDTLFDHAAFAVSERSDGDLFLAGERRNGADRDGLLIRADALGNPIWERVIDHGPYDHLGQVMALPSGVLATGWSLNDEGHQVWLVRRDASGN
ncbi:MAG: hypothetical protein H6597_04595 [Flavobacteriales bacterium]|nr:hypothetical protein [Flavobacteriales bacterium]MCB9193792.1 hypothetical protein [Flavobacteriales bacterium]